MTRRHVWLVGLVAAFVAAATWFFMGRGHDQLAVDLMSEFPKAHKQPADDVFQTIDASVKGRSLPSIFVALPSRLTFSHVTIPESAWLKVSLGVKEEGWTIRGDGVTFMIVISDGKRPEGLLTRDMNPYGVPADRGWRDEMIDLSDYAGETVDLIFNTRAGPQNDTNGDLALWGAPRIVVR